MLPFHLLMPVKNWQKKTAPFDNYIQIIDGAEEIIINKKEFKFKFRKEISPLQTPLLL
jgi:hypothetical protein